MNITNLLVKLLTRFNLAAFSSITTYHKHEPVVCITSDTEKLLAGYKEDIQKQQQETAEAILRQRQASLVDTQTEEDEPIIKVVQ